MYTVESLNYFAPNSRSAANINQKAVDTVNAIIAVLENGSDDKPKSGDVVKILTKKGKKYNAHVCQVDENGIYVCTQPFTPYATENGAANISGGYFQYIPLLSDVKYDGKIFKQFWNFANGSGADKGVYFMAKVNVWEFIGDSDFFY